MPMLLDVLEAEPEFAIPELESDEFLDDVVCLAKQYVGQYFRDKRTLEGTPIPEYLLYERSRISDVLNVSLFDAVGIAYEALEKTLDPQDLSRAEKFGHVTEDIKLVQYVLSDLARRKVPKQFAGGMLLMYLEFCEGVEFE